jgi:hypothetical protein
MPLILPLLKEEENVNGTDIRRGHSDQLAQKISEQPYDRRKVRPLSISPPLAKSLLQKTVRRGEIGLAHRAAATLLAVSPDRFWRRCVVIATEEIGVANTEAVALVTTAATAGKSWRAKHGGEHRLAQVIVSMMVRADKCRAADDLAIVAAWHPALAKDRVNFVDAQTRDLLALAISSSPTTRRALALWHAIGTVRSRTGDLLSRRGDPSAVFNFLCETDLPRSLIEIARDSYRVTGEIICAFLPLLWPEWKLSAATRRDDDFPAALACGPIPSWALDMFTREGRSTLAAFLRGDSETARWVRQHIPPSQRVTFIGGVLFRAESGLVKGRMEWSLAIELRRMADVGCHGPHCADATEIIALLRVDIPLLNEVRAHVR